MSTEPSANMTTHIPGPWQAIARHHGFDIYSIHWGVLAKVYSGTPDLANARLIAVAPDLLEIANQLVAFVDRAREEGAHGLPQSVLDIAEAARIAIAKVKPQEAVRP